MRKLPKNGFLLPIFQIVVDALTLVNFITYWKCFLVRLFERLNQEPLTEAQTKSVEYIAIDLHTLIKWTTIIFLVFIGADSYFAKTLTWYLILANLFSYFYFHVWGSGKISKNDLDSQRRRFINFTSSLFFYIICFAYLFQFQYDCDIKWPDHEITTLNSIYISFANAFTLTYGDVAPLTTKVRLIFIFELINTFFFFTVILTNSIPSPYSWSSILDTEDDS